jgi:hypothetical protein
MGGNFLLTNVGRGLSLGPISISSSSSADVNPYPSFPSFVKSILQMDKEDKKRILANRRDWPLYVFHRFLKLYNKSKASCQNRPSYNCYDYAQHLISKVYALFFGPDRRNRPR